MFINNLQVCKLYLPSFFGNHNKHVVTIRCINMIILYSSVTQWDVFWLRNNDLVLWSKSTKNSNILQHWILFSAQNITSLFPYALILRQICFETFEGSIPNSQFIIQVRTRRKGTIDKGVQMSYIVLKITFPLMVVFCLVW